MNRIALTGLLVITGALVFQGAAKAEEIQGQVVTVMPSANSITIRQSGNEANKGGQMSDLVSLKVDPKAEFKGGLKTLQDVEVGDSLKVEGDKAQGEQQGAASQTYNVKKIEKVGGGSQGQGGFNSSPSSSNSGSMTGAGAGTGGTGSQTY